jgi:hypothetical protein
MKSKILSKQCAKSQTLNNEINQKNFLLLVQKRRKETLNWEQCIICQCSNAEPVICMRDVGKDSFVRSMGECVTTLVCDIVETCSVIVKIYLICFENSAVLFTCIFSIAITVVNNFNFTWYKIVQCGHFLQNKRMHLISKTGSRVELWRFCRSERSLSQRVHD